MIRSLWNHRGAEHLAGLCLAGLALHHLTIVPILSAQVGGGVLFGLSAPGYSQYRQGESGAFIGLFRFDS